MQLPAVLAASVSTGRPVLTGDRNSSPPGFLAHLQSAGQKLSNEETSPEPTRTKPQSAARGDDSDTTDEKQPRAKDQLGAVVFDSQVPVLPQNSPPVKLSFGLWSSAVAGQDTEQNGAPAVESDDPGQIKNNDVSAATIVDFRSFTSQVVLNPLSNGWKLRSTTWQQGPKKAASDPATSDNVEPGKAQPEKPESNQSNPAMQVLGLFVPKVTSQPAPPPASIPAAAPTIALARNSESQTAGEGLAQQLSGHPGIANEQPRSERQSVAFTMTLSHSFEPVISATPTPINPGAATKQTQSATSAGKPSQASAASSTNSTQLNPAPQADAAAANPRGQSGADSERREASDRNPKRNPSDSDSKAPVIQEAQVASAIEKSAPVSLSQHVATAEQPARVEAAPAVARTAAPEPPSDTTKAAPLREINLSLPGIADKAVDVHIVDERGKVHVEVRTSDTQLASSLRDNVGDLVQKLDRSGFRSESVSTHDATPIGTSSASGSAMGNENGHKSASDQQQWADQGGGGHAGQQQQNGQGRGNRPRWLEEIVKNFNPTVQEEENKE